MAIKYTSFLGAPAKDKYMKVRMTFQSCLLLPAKETSLGSLSSWGRVMSVRVKFCRDHRLKIFLSESLNALICNVKPPNKCKIKHQHTEIGIIAPLMWLSSSFIVIQTNKEKLNFI